MLSTVEDVQTLLAAFLRADENLELLFQVCWTTFHSDSYEAAGQSTFPQNDSAFLLYDDRLWKARHLLLSGYYESRFGHYSTALKLYEDAVALSHEVRRLDVRILALCGVAFMHHCLNDNRLAVDLLHSAFELACANGYRREAAVCSDVLGLVHHAWRAYDDAEKWYRRSRDICAEIDLHAGLMMLSQHLGTLYADQGFFGLAREHFLRGQKLLQEHPNTFGAIVNALNLGRLEYLQGELHSSAVSFNRALLLASDHCRSREVLLAMTALALLRRESGDVENALVLLAEALSIAKESGSPLESIVIGEMGESYAQCARNVSAFDCFCWGARRADDQGHAPLLIDAHARLYRYYESIGDRTKAGREHHLVAKIQAELFSGPVLPMVGMNASARASIWEVGKEEDAEEFMDFAVTDDLSPWGDSGLFDPGQVLDGSDDVPGHFLNRLAGLYPELSRMELKIVALLRRNLSTKEIADQLCLSERSIRNHRYRLRKKLHLSGKESLTTFLVSF
jgi:DNA-binding CsgD family transcriptional regulator